jgi:hypothetical protein
LLKKMKNDATKTLGKRTKKHHETLEICKMNIGSTYNNLLSGMSHTHRIFFGFVMPPSYERT